MTNVASAQEDSPFGNCYGRAEGMYMQMSERIISLLQSAVIDGAEFEKYRTQIVNKRESDLRQCAEADSASLSQQMQSDESQNVQGGNIMQERAPASLNPAYVEIESRTDY